MELHGKFRHITRNYKLIESLYANSNSAIIPNNMTGDFFHTMVGVIHGCLLSPVLFNIFLEKIMQDTLQNHKSTIVAYRQIYICWWQRNQQP